MGRYLAVEMLMIRTCSRTCSRSVCWFQQECLLFLFVVPDCKLVLAGALVGILAGLLWRRARTQETSSFPRQLKAHGAGAR